MLKRLGIFLRSSLGRKFLMSLTGAGLMGFLLAHLVGNLTLFADSSGEAFTHYAETLEGNPLLPLAEAGLALLFVVHIALGIRLALDNREARTTRYKGLEAHGERSLASLTMPVTGLIVLIFLIVHLLDFRLDDNSPVGLAGRVVAKLASPITIAVYVVGVLALGVHLWHAFQSAFQSLGINHPHFRPLIRNTGRVFAVGVAAGFVAFPLVMGLAGDKFAQSPTEEAGGQVREAPALPVPADSIDDQREGALR